MLIFKDSITNFVSGAQLVEYNMIKLEDWIELPDGSANGTVEEITLNTVKVRNWDNTISTIPPYTLISTTFKNWRGMEESGGRRVDKRILLDVTTIKMCDEDTVKTICGKVALLNDYVIDPEADLPTNSQLYRTYIVRYLRAHKIVAQSLDLFAAQREVGECGLPIEIYFFLKDKQWEEYETIQTEIFDRIFVTVPKFGLRVYQRTGDKT
jgi:small-conductance mechanosensitive channel